MMDRHAHSLKPGESRVAERVRLLKHPPADTAFRERLKGEFVSGDFGERSLIVAMPPPRPRHFLRWAAGMGVAAAAVIVVAAINQPPRWTALPSAGSGRLVVNGVAGPVRGAGGVRRP